MYNAVANDLVARFSAYQSDDLITNSGADLLRRAYAVAREAHEGQKRASGEPYIDTAVAGLLPDLGAGCLDRRGRCTMWSRIPVGDRSSRRLAAKRHLVDGVTKLSALEEQTKEEAQVGTYRKMFIAMADDPRVVLVKLADRLHNMRTIGAMKPESQKRTARETLDIYAPLAHRLGIWQIKWELEDKSSRCSTREIPGDQPLPALR
jgi:GTP pyrophosphokinase